MYNCTCMRACMAFSKFVYSPQKPHWLTFWRLIQIFLELILIRRNQGNHLFNTHRGDLRFGHRLIQHIANITSQDPLSLIRCLRFFLNKHDNLALGVRYHLDIIDVDYDIWPVSKHLIQLCYKLLFLFAENTK